MIQRSQPNIANRIHVQHSQRASLKNTPRVLVVCQEPDQVCIFAYSVEAYTCKVCKLQRAYPSCREYVQEVHVALCQKLLKDRS